MFYNKRYALLIFVSLAFILNCTVSRQTVRHMHEVNISNVQIPIVYNENYNISFWGFEIFHPFDSHKFGKTFKILTDKEIFKPHQIVNAGIPAKEDLLLVHTPDYLESLKKSETIAEITELWLVNLFGDNSSYNQIMVPMLYQTGGSIIAGELALKHGWSINLGGGFHHASSDCGGGFCAIADVTISIKYLQKNTNIRKVMIIDLDAHQGNGYERDFMYDENVYIVDLYNGDNYPFDTEAKKAIDIKRELSSWIEDEAYLTILSEALNEAFRNNNPDIVYYIAGTDILKNDPLGGLSISQEGVIERDEMVFRQALSRKIPIVMLFGGGYQPLNAEVIAKSIINLNKTFKLIKLK